MKNRFLLLLIMTATAWKCGGLSVYALDKDKVEVVTEPVHVIDPAEDDKRFHDEMLLQWINTPEEEKRKRLGVMLVLLGKHAVRVMKVFPGSIAEGIGLKEGDEIIEINGAPVGLLPEDKAVEMLGKPATKFKLKSGRAFERP